MLESFEVITYGGKYSVSVGQNLVQDINPSRDFIFLVDDYLLDKLPLNSQAVIYIPALETSKNLDYMAYIIEKMRILGANRDTHVYAIGGGIIQDIATFVNSIYMRGLPWTYFPSTLLSMADSCIGGKSSINVRGYKNLVGNIYPPSSVFVDVNFCKTLGPNEIIGGLAEAVKICYARGPEVFSSYLELEPFYPLEIEKGVKVVFEALLAKKWFVETDEFDHAERLLLNYGHTFGHALEASSNFALAHGVAVALGMLVAIECASQIGGLEGVGKENSQKLVAYLNKLLSPLRTKIQDILSKLDWSIVFSKFEGDKKHRQNAYRIVIPASNGGLVLHSLLKDKNSRQLIDVSFISALTNSGFFAP